MRKDPSSPKYIRVEVRTGPIVREDIRIEAVGQTVETEGSMEIIDLDKTTEITTFKGKLEDMEDRLIEENIETTGAMITTEAEIDQEKGHFQGIGIKVPVIVDQGQDLELVLTEIEYGVTIVGNMTILLEIVPTLEKKEI